MDQQLKSNLTSSKHWIRLVYMLLFAFFLYLASFVVGILVIVQFLFALITGVDNRKLRELGGSLTIYIKRVLLFLTFNSESKPFPFADWPEAPVFSAGESVVVEEPLTTAVNPAPVVDPAPIVDSTPVVDPAPVADPPPIIVSPSADNTDVEANPGNESKPII